MPAATKFTGKYYPSPIKKQSLAAPSKAVGVGHEVAELLDMFPPDSASNRLNDKSRKNQAVSALQNYSHAVTGRVLVPAQVDLLGTGVKLHPL